MSTLTKRATVYLDPVLHKALRLQSVETARSVSELINDAVRDELAEDARDLALFDERAYQDRHRRTNDNQRPTVPVPCTLHISGQARTSCARPDSDRGQTTSCPETRNHFGRRSGQDIGCSSGDVCQMTKAPNKMSRHVP